MPKINFFQIISTMFRLVLQTILIFLMLTCILFFASSFEYGSINRYQILYTFLLGLMSVVFVKLASNKAHKHISYYMVLLTTILWVVAILHGMFDFL